MARTRKPYSELSDAAKKRQCLRGSAAWRWLKTRLSRMQGGKCAVSGRKLTTRAAVHHLDLDPEHYDRLDEDANFVYVSAEIHDALHTLYKCPLGWKAALANIADVFQRMDSINGLVDGKPAKEKQVER